MKKCYYCGKEISYYEQYCCDECEKQANKVFRLNNSKKGIFGVFNIIGFFCICIGLFWSMFQPNVGLYILSAALLLVGALFSLLPFGTAGMIEKFQVKKTVQITRIIGIIILIIGLILAAVTTIIYNF
ncbi:MAG: hypothetical protein ACI4I4_02230 [Acutalibacteraceae bacterium]